jgi:hypothetical protein
VRREEIMSEPELIGGEFYLIDEKKCLYKSTKDNGIYYREEGARMFSRQNARSAEDNSAWPGPPLTFTRSK